MVCKTPLVSVVIPTYKRPGMLGRAIDSVLNQSYQNIEIIVVDDNNSGDVSRKDTEVFMEDRYNNQPKVTYLKHEKNKGGSAARNTGITNSNGEYISFLDDDDEYYETKIEKQVAKFLEVTSNNIGVVYCGFNFFDENGNLVNKKATYIKGCTNVLRKHLISSIIGTPGLMIRKEILSKFGTFKDLICGQEYELILRLLRNNVYFSNVPEELVKVNLVQADRISTNEKIVVGINDLMDIKKTYLYLLSDKDQRNVYYFHFQALYMVYIGLGNKSEALSCFIKMVKFGYTKPRLLMDGIYLLLGYKIASYFKHLSLKLFKI